MATMAPEDIERFIAMGTNEEELIELLRQQGRQEDIIDATRDRDPTIRAGANTYVPNIMPIADMFTRGRAEKKIKRGKMEAADSRAGRDQDIRAFLRGAMDNSLDQPVPQSAIQGQAPMPMPVVSPMSASAGAIADPSVGPQGPPQGVPSTPLQAPPPIAAPEPSPAATGVSGLPTQGPPPVPQNPALNNDGTMGLVELIKQKLRESGR